MGWRPKSLNTIGHLFSYASIQGRPQANSHRITARVPAKMRDALEQAAQLQGSTLNQFVVQSAYQEAQRILERETVLRLSQRDAQKVFSMLEHPPKANKQLRDAVKAYHELIS